MQQDMSNCLIEVDDRPVGLLIGEAFGFTFHAACPEVWALDRRIFPSVRAATREARKALDRSRADRPPVRFA